MIALGVFKPRFQSRKAARPSIDEYMAKLDGKRAVDAWKTPGLKSIAIRNKTPIRLSRFNDMAEKSRVWHPVQIRARTMRTK
jgi:hypothetical protein